MADPDTKQPLRPAVIGSTGHSAPFMSPGPSLRLEPPP